MDKNKKILFEDEEYNNFEELNNENNYDQDEHDEHFQYFENTIDIINKELINYIESKYIPLGEYLNKDELNIFLSL